MKIKIVKDEWYPVYLIIPAESSSSGEREATVTKAFLKRVEKAEKEYSKVQELLDKLYDSPSRK